LKESCGYDIGSTAACVDELNDLPVSDDGYVTGNTQGCRALHAVFAQTNQFHCPHVSLSNEDADNNGSFKCSNVTESVDINPEDLFDDSDFELFNQTCEDNDIDPIEGYRVIKPVPP
jgi:hypothetical protein